MNKQKNEKENFHTQLEKQLINQNAINAFHLSEQANLFKILFEDSYSIMLIIDYETGQIVNANKAACRFYGYTLEEITQMKISQINILSPDEIRKEMENAKLGKRNYFNFKHKLKNNEIRDVEVYCGEIIINNQSYLYSIIHDITEKKQLEEQIKKAKEIAEENEKRFRAIYENNSVGIAIVSLDNIIISANQAYCNMLGYQENEIIGKSLKNITSTDTIELNLEYQYKLLNGEINSYQIEKSYIHKDGHIVYGLLSTTIIKDKNNNPLYFIGNVQDITKIKGLQDELKIKVFEYKELLDVYKGMNRELMLKKQQLEESEQRWKFALEGAKDGVWDWNITTDEVYFSLQWKKMLGYEDIDIENNLEAWKNLVHPDDYPFVLDKLQKYLSGEIPEFKNIIRLKCKDGSYKWILDRGIIMERDKNNKPTRMIGTHTDISELIELRNKLAKEIDDKNKLISILAHDLKNSFHPILGFLEILLEDYKNIDENTLSKYLYNINLAANYTYNLLETILLWIKSNSGKIAFKPSLVNICNFCKEIVQNVQVSALRKNIIILFDADKNLVANIDINMISAVLRNLLSNAIKFSNRDSKVYFKVTSDLENITFIIKDEGIGIPEDVKPKLFDIGEKISLQGTENEKGSGLGLIICKEFVEKHGGKIWFESIEGKGTTFYFSLPTGKPYYL